MHKPRLIALIVLCLLLITTLISAQEETTYIIQPGDTLFSIARRFGTTVSELAEANGIVNTSAIFWGQRLVIPADEATDPTPADVTQTITPTPTATTTYVVQPGDTLYRIAVRFQTTITDLRRLNPEIQNSNLVYVNQRIVVPDPNAPAPTPDAAPAVAPTVINIPTETPVAVEAEQVEPTPEPLPTEVPVEPTATVIQAEAEAVPTDGEPTTVAPVIDLEYGIEANFLIEDPATPANYVGELGVGWVKQLLSWNALEPSEGEIDFATLDTLVETLESQNVNILLTITAAPGWTRTIQEETGPPDDYATFANFLSEVASRYAGRVAAYEIWNEPNLRSRWKSTVHPISAASYVEMLRQASDAIKTADPDALVISAGLAPTGFNDALGSEAGDFEVNAIDDRIYLNAMYAAGLTSFVDGVGVHPIGFANPPDARCCNPIEGIETHYGDPHFYFLDTLNDYRQVQLANNDQTLPLWVTRLGWGTVEDLGVADEFNIFVSYTSLDEQAQYLTRAYEIADELNYVGPMFAFSLNGCQAPGIDGPTSCYYGLIGPRGTPRTVFTALQRIAQPANMPVTMDDDSTIAPEATEESSS